MMQFHRLFCQRSPQSGQLISYSLVSLSLLGVEAFAGQIWTPTRAVESVQV